MSEHFATLHWQRSEPALRPGEFSSAHTVRYNDATEVAVDAAPHRCSVSGMFDEQTMSIGVEL